MRNLILLIIAIVVALLLWLFWLKKAECFGFSQKESFQKWTELTISYCTFVALIIAGGFAYIKYDAYVKESNYQKAIVRYVDNNVDLFVSELSKYTTNVILALNNIMGQIRQNELIDKAERIAIYKNINSGVDKIVSSSQKLIVFDPLIYRSAMSIINESGAVLSLILKQDLNQSDIEILSTKKMIIENWSRFIIFNLQDISELLRKSVKAYESPNIEEIKDKFEYKEIIEKFKKYIALWQDMESAKNKLYSYKEKNRALERSNNAEFKKTVEELGETWNKKTMELCNYIVEYVNSKGIPIEKVTIKQSPNL